METKPKPEDARTSHTWLARLAMFGPAIVATAIAIAVTYHFVQPAPPKHIVMAAGPEASVYSYYARAYRDAFASAGITLTLLETHGSRDNVARLQSGEADVGFVQSGTTADIDAPNLRSLGSFYFEPVWLFTRDDLPLQRLGDLRGRRVAIDEEGSGTRAIALQLLADEGVAQHELALVPLGGNGAAESLRAGQIDAAFFVMPARDDAVHRLLTAPGIRLVSIDRPAAQVLQHRFLSRLDLPEGAIDLPADLPRADTVLLAAAANLAVRDDFHPALAALFLETGKTLHGEPGLFAEAGQFPSRQYIEFPLSDAARRYFDRGPSFLQRYLPFWAASLVDRLAIWLLPLVTIVYPIFKVIPTLYDSGMLSRINRWYKELQAIEWKFATRASPDEIRRRLAELDAIEARVQKLTMPVTYGNPLYTLRLHIAFLRGELQEALARSDAAAHTKAAR